MDGISRLFASTFWISKLKLAWKMVDFRTEALLLQLQPMRCCT